MSTLVKTQDKTLSTYIKSAVGLFFMFGFGYLPAIEPLTPMGMKIAGIFIGLIFLLCTVSIIWPSLLSIVALGMSGYCTVGEAIGKGLGSELVWMMLILLILSEAMATSGMGEILARWIITRKFLNGRPMLFTFIYMWGLGVCSILVGSIVVVLMSWQIFYIIADMAGYKKGEKYSTLMLIGCFLSAIMFEGLLSFQSWLLALSQTYQEMTSVVFNHVAYFAVGFVVLTIFILFIVLSMKYIFKCDFDKLNTIDVAALENSDAGRLNFKHKFYLGCWLLIVAYIFMTTLLPADFPLIAFLNTITQSGWFAFVLCLGMILHYKGEPILDFAEVAKTGANWNILLMCMAIMPLASALTSDATGVRTLINNFLSPIVGNMGPVTFLVTIMIAMMILTNIGSNMATGIIMITVALPFVTQYYYSPMIIGMAIIFIANMGFILPGSSGMAPFLYSNEWIGVKNIYKYGVFCAILFLLAAIPVYLVASFIL